MNQKDDLNEKILTDSGLLKNRVAKSGRPMIIVIDGIIGAGKSTYLEVLQQDLTALGLRIALVKEPVEKWKSSGILQRFYNDQKRWAYHFQAKAFHDRIVENIEMYEKYGNNVDIYILERSCFTDNLFMDMLYDGKIIDDLELQHYKEWWSLWVRIMPYKPDLFIYLKPDIDVCMQRLSSRNRPGEENIPKAYQEALEARHDQFFSSDFIDLRLFSIKIPENSTMFKNSGLDDTQYLIPVNQLKTNLNFKDDLLSRKEIIADFLSKLLVLPTKA